MHPEVKDLERREPTRVSYGSVGKSVWATGGLHLLVWLDGFIHGGLSMPTYDYVCRKCGHSFQRIEKISDHGEKKVKCPECKSTKVEQVFSSVFVKTSRKS